MTRLEPPVTEVSQPFWEATKRRELTLQWCRSCEKPVHYPREACPSCLGDDLEFRPASGRGEVHAFIVMHEPGNPTMADRVPYVVALIELGEGVRFMSNVVGCTPSEVRVGMPVEVTWEDLSDGRLLPQFQPVQ